jgi:hypothetical protein
MTEYYVDPEEHPDGECALCGEDWDLVVMYVRHEGRAGRTTITSCRRCETSVGSQRLMDWLRSHCEQKSEKWEEILHYQRGRRTGLAQLIHAVYRAYH